MPCHKKNEPQTLNYEPRDAVQYIHSAPKALEGVGGGKHVENLLPSTMMTKHRFSSSVLSPAG